MSMSERQDPKGGPLCNLSQAYFGSLDGVAKVYEPALRGVGRWNLELFNLMTRRTQAWLDLPVQFSRCRTPQDAVSAYLKFWQQAVSQYADGSHRLVAALGSFPAMRGFNGAWNGKAAEQARDYITFPEAKETAPAETPKRGDRRAA